MEYVCIFQKKKIRVPNLNSLATTEHFFAFPFFPFFSLHFSNTHTHTHTHTRARTHTRTHARTHARTHGGVCIPHKTNTKPKGVERQWSVLNHDGYHGQSVLTQA